MCYTLRIDREKLLLAANKEKKKKEEAYVQTYERLSVQFNSRRNQSNTKCLPVFLPFSLSLSACRIISLTFISIKYNLHLMLFHFSFSGSSLFYLTIANSLCEHWQFQIVYVSFQSIILEYLLQLVYEICNSISFSIYPFRISSLR